MSSHCSQWFLLCPFISTESQLSFKPIHPTAFWSSLPLKHSRFEIWNRILWSPANLPLFLDSLLSLPIWAAITRNHTLGGLNDKYLSLTVLEAGKSKIKVPADLVPRSHCCCWMGIATHMLPSNFHSHIWHLAYSLELRYKMQKEPGLSPVLVLFPWSFNYYFPPVLSLLHFLLTLTTHSMLQLYLKPCPACIWWQPMLLISLVLTAWLISWELRREPAQERYTWNMEHGGARGTYPTSQTS